MAIDDPVVLAQIVGFGVFFWLGSYVLVRAAYRTVLIVAAALGLFTQAMFFASSALTYTAPDLAALALLERWFWWTAVVPIAIWFHFSTLIAAPIRLQRSARVFSPLVILVYISAAAICILGSLTDLFLRYSDPAGQAGPYLYIGPGPAYVVQIAYLGMVAAGAFVNLLRALRASAAHEPTRDGALTQQLKLLVVGAVLFLIGALWIVARYNWVITAYVLPGYLFLFAGVAVLGYGIANYGLLLEGQDIRRDFFYTLTGIGLINVLYAGLLSLVEPLSVYSLLVLVSLVTLTHTTFDRWRGVLDRLFFTAAEQTARAEARDYATLLGTVPVTAVLPLVEQPSEQPVADADEPVAATEIGGGKAFKDAVRKAITGLKSPPQLAKSPLLTLRLVEQHVQQAGLPDNRLNRAAALREILIAQIEGLRPTDDASGPVGEPWRFYNVLYYPYIHAVSRKGALSEARRLSESRRRQGQAQPEELEQVLAWLADIDEDTFYKWQRRGSDTIAATLWEENLKLSEAC
ncbi:MAG TPA: hypothetical protein VFZ66_30270 [Herpetosiphonaceae bacterium]